MNWSQTCAFCVRTWSLDRLPPALIELDDTGPRLKSVLARVELLKMEKFLSRLEETKDVPTMEATFEEYVLFSIS